MKRKMARAHKQQQLQRDLDKKVIVQLQTEARVPGAAGDTCVCGLSSFLRVVLRPATSVWQGNWFSVGIGDASRATQ